MTINEHDLQLYARRVRLHFDRELRDAAEELAFAISWWAGPRTKSLRPETSLQEILSWMGAVPHASGLDELDAVAMAMALEEEVDAEFPAVLLNKPLETTFLDLVRQVAARRAKQGN